MNKNVKNNNILNISSRKAVNDIKALSRLIKEKYRQHGFKVQITLDKSIPMLRSESTLHLKEGLWINIGIKELIKKNQLGLASASNIVPEDNYVNTIVALFHENRHIEALSYNCEGFAKDMENLKAECLKNIHGSSNLDINKGMRNNFEYDYALMVNYLSREGNEQYYYNNYENMSSEIDAEQYSINMAYMYLKNMYPNIDAEKLIVNYINNRIDTETYKINFPKYADRYSSLREINNAFDIKIQQVIHLKREINLGATDEICTLIGSNSEWQPIKDKITSLMSKCNIENAGLMMDEMLASIVIYRYPEYRNLLTDEWKNKLSPESIFGLKEFPLEDWQLDNYYYRDDERE